MTKKDYIKIARALKVSMPETLLKDKSQLNKTKHAQWWLIARSIVDELQNDNPKFDEVKFFEFVGVFIGKKLTK
mgnify:FL=1